MKRTGSIRIIRLTLFFFLTLTAVLSAAWLALQCFPQPLFRYQESWSNVRVYSDRPIPPQAKLFVDTARARLTRCPWNDTSVVHHIFLCQSRWRFALLTGPSYKVSGQNSIYLKRNIWIRTVNWQTGRIINYAGKEVPGDRTLPYYLAHEMTHGITIPHTGRLVYYRLPPWIREGYADYVARPDFQFEAMRDAFVRGDLRVDPFTSGFYWRYQLKVQYLLEIRKISVDSLFKNAIDPTQLETQIREGAR